MGIERIIRTYSKYQKMAKRSVEAFKRLASPWNKVIFGSMSSTCIKCDTSLFECASSISKLAKFHLKLLQVFQRTAVTGRLTLVGQRPIKITLVHLSVRPSVLPPLSFLKIGLLVFSDNEHDDSWPCWSWYLVTSEARFLKKTKLAARIWVQRA